MHMVGAAEIIGDCGAFIFTVNNNIGQGNAFVILEGRVQALVGMNPQRLGNIQTGKDRMVAGNIQVYCPLVVTVLILLRIANGLFQQGNRAGGNAPAAYKDQACFILIAFGDKSFHLLGGAAGGVDNDQVIVVKVIENAPIPGLGRKATVHQEGSDLARPIA